MATDYVIDTSLRLVRTTPSGHVTAAEIGDLRRRLLADAAFDPTFSQLIDASAVTKLDMGAPATDTIRALAQQYLFAPRSRQAIVVSAPHDLGLFRMFQTYRELAGGQEDIHICTTMEEALVWLESPPPSAVA